jgi:triosephosphate isomerase (TIM)
MRRKVVAGNWKMNMNIDEGYKLATDILNVLKEPSANMPGVILCTPYIHIAGVADILSGSSIETGAQNCSPEPSGAFTGEISAQMIKSTGAGWVIIGHSERRSLFNEDDELVRRKTIAAIDAGLKVIFCCGEILKERNDGVHFETVRRQLTEGLFNLEKEKFTDVIIAYEPVWAIGTGVTASPEQAQEMHSFIRNLVAEAYGESIAAKTTILYGGSCKASNASDLFSRTDVDGGLIGGASLMAGEFTAIVQAAAN